MPKVLVVDPASPARDGWHEIFGNSDDALNGNISRVFLAGVPQSVATTKCRQPDDWSCGPYSLAECLGQANGEDARNWLLARGLITSQYGTEYSGIVGYLNSKGYSCAYDGRAHDGEMNGSVFDQIIQHLQGGHKVILCMHGTSKGCRTNYWTRSGHYICVYGIDSPDDSYSFTASQVKEGDNNNVVKLLQKILYSRDLYAQESGFDGSFGPKTKEAVIRYQKYINAHGGNLAVDGVCGPATWTSIMGFYGTTKGSSVTFTVRQIKPSSHNVYVLLAQEILKADGYYHSSLDRNYGPATEKAVKSFQKKVGIAVDGICGPTTFKKLLNL